MKRKKAEEKMWPLHVSKESISIFSKKEMTVKVLATNCMAPCMPVLQWQRKGRWPSNAESLKAEKLVSYSRSSDCQKKKAEAEEKLRREEKPREKPLKL